MRIRKLLPVLCMALGLTMAAPLAAGATGNTDAGTVSGTTQDTQTTNATGWHNNDEDGSRYYTINGKIVTGFQWIANSKGQKNLYYFNPDTGLLRQSEAAGRIKIGNDYYYTFGPKGNCAIATTQGWIPKPIMFPVRPTTVSCLPTRLQKSESSTTVSTNTASAGLLKDAAVLEPRFTM